jgi:hypothetical protein
MKSEIRIAGEFISPNKHKFFAELTRDSKGIGRWIYCKYCYKNVKPQLSGVNQVICSVCNSGLTPDFFKFENLLRYLKGGDYEIIRKDDMQSNEYKEWMKLHKK